MSLIGCNAENTLCLYQQTQGSDSLITLEAKVGSNNGWASFGIGKEMIGSPLYVFWKNSAGDCVVSRREATGYVQPLASNNQAEKITDLDSSVSSKANGANLKCTMTRPLSMSPSLGKDFIWAIGAGVVDVNDAKSNFARHSDMGTLVLQTAVTPDKKDPNDASMSTLSILAVLATLMTVLC